MEDTLTLRGATPADAAAAAEIYAPYVEETAISFEYTAPDAGEMARRIAHTLLRYPFLVAERRGELLGYAYLGPLKDRRAYDISAEASVYVRRGETGQGVGRALYAALEREAKARGIRKLYACIARPNTDDDPYLDHNSIAFHTRMGYRQIGDFRDCAVKFDRIYSMIWMEKIL